MTKQELLAEAKRINAKLAGVVDGEAPLPAMYALLSIAAYCTNELGMSNGEAVGIFSGMLAKRRGL